MGQPAKVYRSKTIRRRRNRVRDVSKPPYRVPTMGEVADLEPNGFKVVSTFSGAGGSCLGFRMAGYEVLWASEFVPAAREVYRLNHPDSHLDERDIREVKARDVLRQLGLKEGELDVLEGSPPCASFSMAGKREGGWGEVKQYSDTEQRVDDLFFEYARLLKGLRPKVFVAENVRGLTVGKAKGYFIEILEALEACGYVVEAQVLDAQWFGVPQRRQRVIFQGVRKDLGLVPCFPTPLPYRYSLREVLGVTLATKFTQSELVAVTDIQAYAIGREARKLKPGEQSEKYLNLIRAHEDEPCPTVTQLGGSNPGVASVIHPNGTRKFMIDELKAICAFPPDFELTGSFGQQWERLGRAVPPLMMRAVAESVRDGVLRKL